jgi:hypothetical protein
MTSLMDPGHQSRCVVCSSFVRTVTHVGLSSSHYLRLPAREIGRCEHALGKAHHPHSMTSLMDPGHQSTGRCVACSSFVRTVTHIGQSSSCYLGLPAWEIGRCERALREALEWRLWVGKVPRQCVLPRSQSVGSLCSNRVSLVTTSSASADPFSSATGVVWCLNSFPGHALSFSAVPTLPFSTTIPLSTQGSRMPTPESSVSEFSPTPTLNVSDDVCLLHLRLRF